MDLREELNKRYENLQRLRDELKVRGVLAKAELRDRWHDLEREWPELDASIRRYQQRTGSAAGELNEATSELLTRLKTEYEKLRERLREQ